MKNLILFLIWALFAQALQAQQPSHPVVFKGDQAYTYTPERAKMVRQVLKNSKDYNNTQLDSARLRNEMAMHTEELSKSSGNANLSQRIQSQLDETTRDYRLSVQFLSDYRHNTWLLAQTFDQMPGKSKRVAKARKFFLKGDFNAAAASMEADRMDAEMKPLLSGGKRPAQPDPKTAQQLDLLAEEWWLLASLTQASVSKSDEEDLTAQYYENAVVCRPEAEMMFHYATYLYDNEDFVSAANWFVRCADACFSSDKQSLGWTARFNGAGAYFLGDSLSLSEEIYLPVIEQYRKEVKQKGGEYQIDLARALSNLGVIYTETKRWDKAAAAYQESYELFHNWPDQQLEDLPESRASLLFNYGSFLIKSKQQFKQAEGMLVEASNLWGSLAEERPIEFEPKLADVSMELGNLYLKKSDYRRAEKEFLKAANIYSRLAYANPKQYETNFANALGHLAELYDNQQKYKQADNNYRRCVDIYRKWVKLEPGEHESNLASSLLNYGVARGHMNDAEGSIALYREALAIWEELEKKSPGEYTDAIASVNNNLGVTYYNMDNWPEAEKAYVATLEAFQQLENLHPGQYFDEVARSENNLGLFYIDVNRLPEGIVMLEKALKVREKQYAEAPDVFSLDLAYGLNNLGYAYLKNGQVEAAGPRLKRSQELKSDNSWVYRNLACYYALQNDIPNGIANLRKAADLGYNEPNWLAQEKSIDPLRGHADFPAIAEKIRKNALPK